MIVLQFNDRYHPWGVLSLTYAVIAMSEFADDGMRADSAIWSAHVGSEDKDRYFRQFSDELQKMAAVAAPRSAARRGR